MAAKSTSAKYYASNPEARAKKASYDKKFNQKPEQRAKRSELVKVNREHQKSGKGKIGDGKDVSHTKNGLVLKSASVNRGSKSDSQGDRRARGNRK
jgi:hypothetical protein